VVVADDRPTATGAVAVAGIVQCARVAVGDAVEAVRGEVNFTCVVVADPGFAYGGVLAAVRGHIAAAAWFVDLAIAVVVEVVAASLHTRLLVLTAGDVAVDAVRRSLRADARLSRVARLSAA